MRTRYFSIYLFLLSLSTASFAILPPKYLSVPYWKNCSGVVTKGTAQFVCLPSKKPKHCPPSSWKTLTQHKLIEKCKD